MIRTLYEKGWSIHDLSIEFRKPTIDIKLTTADLNPVNVLCMTYTDKKASYIMSLYKQGQSVDEISTLFDKSFEEIKSLIDRNK